MSLDWLLDGLRLWILVLLVALQVAGVMWLWKHRRL